MKKNLLFILPLFLLSSCNTNNSNPSVGPNAPVISEETGLVYFYKSYMEGTSYFKEFQKGKDDESKCYVMCLYLDNETSSSYKISKTSFKLNFDNKDNDCLFIVDSFKEEGGTSSGSISITTKKYVTSALDEKEFEKKENHFELFYIAFETRPVNEEFKLTYKGVEINKDIPTQTA